MFSIGCLTKSLKKGSPNMFYFVSSISKVFVGGALLSVNGRRLSLTIPSVASN